MSPSPLIAGLLNCNVKAFRTRLPDLQAQLHGRNPTNVCLQKTHVCPSLALRLRGYTTQRYDHTTGETASGGTAILVKDCIYCVPVKLSSPLQDIAMRVHLPTFHLTPCNIYLPPAVTVYRPDLANLLPVTITIHPSRGFNARYILWGGNLTDDRGTLVHDVRADFDSTVLNIGAYTHLCLESGTSSALDRYFCSPGISLHSDWSFLPDLHGSDHYPVNLHMTTPSPTLSSTPK
jgi:hypothetical protein